MVGGAQAPKPSPKPSLKDTSNQGILATLVPSPLFQHHSTSIILTHPHKQPTSQSPLNDGRCPGLALNQYIRSKVRHHSEAGIEATDNEGYGWPHPAHLCSHQTMDSKVAEVQCQLLHQWHQCQRDWEVLCIHIVDNSPVGNLEAIWR